jgi:pyruvate dehydrogenase E1 component alpha subunit
MTSQHMTVAKFDIFYRQFLDSQGQLTQDLPVVLRDPKTANALLIKMYEAMVKTRLFDSKAITLQRTGKLGTYASTLGQEAMSIGIAAAMRDTDVFCPYYRDYGAQFWRGVSMTEILRYWGGTERGSDYANCLDDFPLCVPIASQTLHAAGIAYAFKYRKEDRVAVTVVGDGGTSRGDFYEAMNWAGVQKLPIVFFINNNQWAISVPRSKQSNAETLAQKAIAAGIHGEQVDGNDIIAVYARMHEAVERARKGQGPSLIEALSYRVCDHTTADDARRYRSIEELTKYQLEDPILRLNKYLSRIEAWDDKMEEAFKTQAQQSIQQSVDDYLKTPIEKPESMFDYLYETLPEALFEQRAIVQSLPEIKHG